VNRWTLFMAMVFAVACCGCSSTYMISDPNKSEMTGELSDLLKKSKFKVPCRVEVHCPESITSVDSKFFGEDTYNYQLQNILKSSFESAANIAFEAPRSEVIDAFTLYVSVPESQLKVDGSDITYNLHVIVVLKDPSEKKIDAFEINWTPKAKPALEGMSPSDTIYKAAREVAFDSVKKLAESPKVRKIAKRLEDR